MVLEMGADAGQVRDDRDPERAQVVGWSDARELKELRRVECAAGQDHLAGGNRLGPSAPPLDLDPGGPTPIEVDLRDERIRTDAQIPPPEDGMEVRTGGGDPAATPSWR